MAPESSPTIWRKSKLSSYDWLRFRFGARPVPNQVRYQTALRPDTRNCWLFAGFEAMVKAPNSDIPGESGTNRPTSPGIVPESASFCSSPKGSADPRAP